MFITIQKRCLHNIKISYIAELNTETYKLTMYTYDAPITETAG